MLLMQGLAIYLKKLSFSSRRDFVFRLENSEDPYICFGLAIWTSFCSFDHILFLFARY